MTKNANEMQHLFIKMANFLLLLLFVYLDITIFYENRPSIIVESLLNDYAILGIIMLFWSTIIIYKEQKEITVILTILVMLYFMAYGQVWTRYFHIPVLRAIDIFRYESHQSGLKAIAFSQLCCHFMSMIAYNSILHNKRIDKQEVKLDTEKYPNESYILVGIILFCIGIIPSIYNDGLTIISGIRSGYSLSSIDRTGIWDDLAMLLRPAYFMLMVGKYDGKRNLSYKFIYYFAITWESLLMVLGGTRGLQITMLIAIYWLDKKLRFGIVKIKSKEIILLILSLSILGIITTYRKTPVSMWNMNTILYSLFNDNYLIQIIAEFGATLQTLIIAIDVIPKFTSYKYGLSYILAPIMLLPNINNFVNDLADKLFANRILRSYTIHNIGGSFIAELYFNFGQLGFLFSAIFSAIITNISQLTFPGKKNSKLQMVIIAGLMSTIPFLARSSMSEIVRIIFMRVFVPYFLIKLLSNVTYKTNSINNIN